MMQQDVVAIFGCKPGSYATKGIARRLVSSQREGAWLENYKALAWNNDSAFISVKLDPTGHVAHKDFIRAENPDVPAMVNAALTRLRDAFDW
jgi:hypothetical protein